MKTQLPPGPRTPAMIQTLGQWSRPTAYLERCRARYGPRFTLRTLGQPPFVVISTPDEIKQMFMAPPEVLHPGEGARILEPIVGSNSVILLDEGPHLEQRKLMLPAFHGERMQRLTGMMEELIEREVSSWPLRAAAGAAPTPAEPDPGDHPASRVRLGAGRRPRGAAHAADGDPGVRRKPALADPARPPPYAAARSLRRACSARAPVPMS